MISDRGCRALGRTDDISYHRRPFGVQQRSFPTRGGGRARRSERNPFAEWSVTRGNAAVAKAFASCPGTQDPRSCGASEWHQAAPRPGHHMENGRWVGVAEKESVGAEARRANRALGRMDTRSFQRAEVSSVDVRPPMRVDRVCGEGRQACATRTTNDLRKYVECRASFDVDVS